jgi:hypothetical protein
MEFIDDYRLLACVSSESDLAPSLALIDMEDVGGAPIRTNFSLSPELKGDLYLVEQSACGPPPEESQDPFHPDPAQRIVVLYGRFTGNHLAVSVGALLEFRSCGGTEIPWDEWKSQVIVLRPPSGKSVPGHCWVSGCRLFSICSSKKNQIQVYDFSAQGRARYLSKEVNQSLGGLRCMSPAPAQVRIPRNTLLELRSGYGGVIFPYVSTVILFFSGLSLTWRCILLSSLSTSGASLRILGSRIQTGGAPMRIHGLRWVGGDID